MEPEAILHRGDARPTRRSGARRAGLLLAVLALLAGCITPGPIVPYPEVARVPHPLQPGPEASLEELLERYSASPNRDPDGLGVLGALWLNSRMTLVTWPVARAREAANRVAFARSEAEQARELAHAREVYGQHWVFEGVLLGDLAKTVSVEFYRPDGIYLVDDRGRKFYPDVARDIEPLAAAQVRSRFGEGHYGYPRLIFPREAIGTDTRAVSLYFAAQGRRLRFAWVFDPDLAAPAGAPGLDSGREHNRLFPPR